jgi:hypothetical protein
MEPRNRTCLDLWVLMALAQMHVAVNAVHCTHAPLQHVWPLGLGLPSAPYAATRARHDLQQRKKNGEKRIGQRTAAVQKELLVPARMSGPLVMT